MLNIWCSIWSEMECAVFSRICQRCCIFWGAAELAQLDPNCPEMAIYGRCYSSNFECFYAAVPFTPKIISLSWILELGQIKMDRIGFWSNWWDWWVQVNIWTFKNLSSFSYRLKRDDFHWKFQLPNQPNIWMWSWLEIQNQRHINAGSYSLLQ